MGTSYYCDEFKRDLEQQITVRGYLVSEAALRLGVSSRSLYKWLKLFGEPMAKARAGASDRGARYINCHGPRPACARYKRQCCA